MSESGETWTSETTTWRFDMKQVLALALAATLFAALSPVGAQAGTVGPQKHEGNVLLPAPGPNDPTGCWQGWARRAWIFSGGATASPLGDMFEIDKSTWGGKFKLEVAGGMAGTEDLDVTFYANPGTVDPVNDPAQQGGIVETGSYLTREAGGEVGTVPPTSTVVLVCLATGTGANADYTYTATPPKKKK
jgi:hypothetical protein